jgi:glutathione S-transferase
MLTFYYHPLSPIARRVWICLLEKQIPFEPKIVQLQHKDQFEPEFLALNPFHHVPVIVERDVKLIESIAILDYLDRAYPTPPMSLDNPAALGKMRMVQMAIANELMPIAPAIVVAEGQLYPEHPKAQTLTAALTFLEGQLSDRYYFGGEAIDLADCVAGATLPLLRRLGVDFSEYPQLEEWMDRLCDRPSWRQTEPSADDFDRWRRWIQLMVKRSDSHQKIA